MSRIDDIREMCEEHLEIPVVECQYLLDLLDMAREELGRLQGVVCEYDYATIGHLLSKFDAAVRIRRQRRGT